MDIAQVTGTQAVIKSPHLERLTPRVSRRGCVRRLHQRTVQIKVIKKKIIKKTKKNHSQYWYCKIWRNPKSLWTKDGDAIKGSG